jgi:hypothetical protein
VRSHIHSPDLFSDDQIYVVLSCCAGLTGSIARATVAMIMDQNRLVCQPIRHTFGRLRSTAGMAQKYGMKPPDSEVPESPQRKRFMGVSGIANEKRMGYLPNQTPSCLIRPAIGLHGLSANSSLTRLP